MKYLGETMHLNHLEWESLTWPIRITHVNCEPNIDNIPDDAIFEIYRERDHKLQGKVTGIRRGISTAEDFQNSQINSSTTVFGYSLDGNRKYKINDVVLGNFTLQHTKLQGETLEHFSQDVCLSSIEEIFTDIQVSCLCEYYLSQRLDVFFPRRTSRKQTNNYFKIREDQDKEAAPSFVDNSSGWSSDYMKIQTKDFDFIIQKDSQYSPNWADGIIIEYQEDFRGIPPIETRIAVAEIVSFALGTHLLNIGTTELNSENFILRRKACSPWGNDVTIKCRQPATPPIDIFGYRKKEVVESEITNLVNRYLAVHKDLDLSGILWRLWISRMTPIGTNLPILSSALESLASNYLDVNSLKYKYSKQEKEKFNSIIHPIVVTLETELEEFEFKTKLLNKLKNPYHKGVGEILSEFLNRIGIDFGNKSIEALALQARNKMAHGNVIKENTDLNALIRISRAYESLFNRALLLVLGYEGAYIDYYSKPFTERSLSSNISNE